MCFRKSPLTSVRILKTSLIVKDLGFVGVNSVKMLWSYPFPISFQAMKEYF